jgi:penicillin-binding protein 2
VQKNLFSGRKLTIIIIFLSIGLIFVARLFYIQIINKEYKLSAENNVLRNITEYPARGLIYDRNGKLLVYNEATYDLMVIPRQVREDLDTAFLCKLLGVETSVFRKRLLAARAYSPYLPTIIEEKLPKNVYGMLQEQLISFPGFYIQARTIRNYPQPVAAHVLGYVGEVTPDQLAAEKYYRPGDYIGISGIEKSYEKELRGSKGNKVIMVDVHGRDKGRYMSGMYDTEARAGQDIYATIDLDLQLYGELLMQNKRGSVVAIEPATGEILAMISSPTYDPSLLVGRNRARNYFRLIADKNLPLFNRAITGKYPPGSTFKPVVGLVAEEEKALTADTRYACGGGFPLGGGRSVGCHAHYGPLDLEGAIQHSCNTYFCRAFKATIENKKYRSTRDAFTAWREKTMSFGLGQKTGIDLPGESAGNIPSADYYDRIFGKSRWRALSVISVSIGQGEIQLTPLQLANITCVIANRGYFLTPHIVRAIGNNENMNPRFRARRYAAVSPQYFNVAVKGMYMVVEAGTAYSVRIDSVSMCGKTGTAQNAGKNHSLFIAFAPMHNPKIAIAAIVENSGYGSTWAAPVVSLMVEYYLTHKIKRTYLEERIIRGTTID